MPARKWTNLVARMSLAGALALASLAQAAPNAACTANYTPKVGQPGKDVAWIPTPEPLVSRMLALARVEPSDVVYDLGSGDGRIVIAAARLGARAVGVEYNPKLVALSRCLISQDGLANRARIIGGDLFRTDFSDASVVTLFLLPDLDVRLRPKLLALKPGTRIVSNEYLIGDWAPDERVITPDGMLYLWVVPANVNGGWTFRARRGRGRFAVTFVQDYQRLTGLLEGGGLLTDPRLAGNDISFGFDDGRDRVRVSGVLAQGRIEAKLTRRGRTTVYVGTRS